MSDMHTIDKKKNTGDELKLRDAETQIVLGIFVSVLAIPVLIGTFWSDVQPHAGIVNFVAGLVLLGVGLGLLLFGTRARKRIKQRT